MFLLARCLTSLASSYRQQALRIYKPWTRIINLEAYIYKFSKPPLNLGSETCLCHD